MESLPLILTDLVGISQYTNPQCAINIKRGNDLVTNFAREIERLVLDKELIYTMGNVSKVQSSKFNTMRYYKKFNNLLEYDNCGALGKPSVFHIGAC